MKKLLFLLVAGLTFTQCSDDENLSSCSTFATVRDLSGVDGCSLVFELEDGKRLEPMLVIRCGTPGYTERITTQALENFDLTDGMRVKISYEETGNMSICMVGPVVKITCIQEVTVDNPEED